MQLYLGRNLLFSLIFGLLLSAAMEASLVKGRVWEVGGSVVPLSFVLAFCCGSGRFCPSLEQFCTHSHTLANNFFTEAAQAAQAGCAAAEADKGLGFTLQLKSCVTLAEQSYAHLPFPLAVLYLRWYALVLWKASRSLHHSKGLVSTD